MAKRPVALKVENVSMKFNLSSEKVDNVKEYIIKMIKKELMFQEFWALRDISFEVRRGDRLGILGLNGAGKSTLLKLLTKRDDVTSGDIYVGDQSVRRLTRKKIPYFRRQFGIMDKEVGLLEHMDLYQNVELALIATEQPEAVRRPKVMRILKLMGLAGKEDHLPIEVSIGERARAMLARAIVTDPAILVLDEPTANLDREGIRMLTEKMQRVEREA